jgi:hypothetical protein
MIQSLAENCEIVVPRARPRRDLHCPQSPTRNSDWVVGCQHRASELGMAFTANRAERSFGDNEDDHCEIVHIEDIEELKGDGPEFPSLLRVHSHSEDDYDIEQAAADLAGTTPTQSDFSPLRHRSSKMTGTTPSPQRTGVSPSSSPRLPSPPPFTEVQIGPKSPTIGEGPENQFGEAARHDDSATRRIRPGTKAADMASGPPLIALAEV